MGKISVLQQAFGCHQQGEYEEAERLYSQIVEEEPENAIAWCLLGMVARRREKVEEAIAYYQKAIAIKPDFTEARFNLGNALSAIGQVESAIACYQSLLTLEPHHAGAYSNLGLLYHKQNQIDRALEVYQKAIALDPTQVETLYNLGNLFKSQGQFDRAIVYYQQALELKPHFPEVLVHLGKVMEQQGKITEAITQYQRALEIRPDYTEAYYTLGNTLLQQGHFSEAILTYHRCLKINPQEAQAHTGLAFALLSLGFLEQGFAEYEWRWQTPEFTAYPVPYPAWDGTPLPQQRLLIRAEQGFGDAIQMIRYLPWVYQQGAKVILECREPLKRLFLTVPEIEEVVIPGESLPVCRAGTPQEYPQVSLMSLPYLSRTTLSTIPPPRPFSLPPLPESLTLSPTTGCLKVGLAWSGHREHPNNHLRSCPLSEILPLLKAGDVAFYLLQKEVSERDSLLLPSTGIHPLPPQCQDFLDTAHIITQLDLIITVDTAIAHLSATLGKPTWLLLHFFPDWRWMVVRLDSPWYPTIRLFRQNQPGDWSTVIRQVQQKLTELINSAHGPQ